MNNLLTNILTGNIKMDTNEHFAKVTLCDYIQHEVVVSRYSEIPL